MTFGQIFVAVLLYYVLIRQAINNFRAYAILKPTRTLTDESKEALKRLNPRVFEAARRNTRPWVEARFKNLFFCLLLSGSLIKMLVISIFIVGVASTFGIIG